MRENFLSLNQISKQKSGFKFYSKDRLILFELISVDRRDIHVASGILGDKYQEVVTIEIMDKLGNRYIRKLI